MQRSFFRALEDAKYACSNVCMRCVCVCVCVCVRVHVRVCVDSRLLVAHTPVL